MAWNIEIVEWDTEILVKCSALLEHLLLDILEDGIIETQMH